MGRELLLWASLEKTFCGGLSPAAIIHISPMCKICCCTSKTLWKSLPIMASCSGSKSRTWPSKLGLGKQRRLLGTSFLGYRSLRTVLSYLCNTHPKHNRRTSVLKACPKGKDERHTGPLGILELTGQVHVTRSCSAVLCGSWFYSLDS